jgi:hypothetical protein
MRPDHLRVVEGVNWPTRRNRCPAFEPVLTLDARRPLRAGQVMEVDILPGPPLGQRSCQSASFSSGAHRSMLPANKKNHRVA